MFSISYKKVQKFEILIPTITTNNKLLLDISINCTTEN